MLLDCSNGQVSFLLLYRMLTHNTDGCIMNALHYAMPCRHNFDLSQLQQLQWAAHELVLLRYRCICSSGPVCVTVRAAGPCSHTTVCWLQVLLGTRYNEKADIFGLGMIMYELFTNNMRLLQVCVQRNKQKSVLRYAHRVAKGMRPLIPE